MSDRELCPVTQSECVYEDRCRFRDCRGQLVAISPTTNHADSNAQAAPTGKGLSVTDAVISDLNYRRVHGTEKYGTELRTNNGRRALVDAYQEALDLCLYLKQELMEDDQRGTQRSSTD